MNSENIKEEKEIVWLKAIFNIHTYKIQKEQKINHTKKYHNQNISVLFIISKMIWNHKQYESGIN